MNWKDIKIDTSKLEELEALAKYKENSNPACSLIKYWSDRINHRIKKEAIKMGKLGYGFVGDGWPNSMDQTWVLEHDKRGLQKAFEEHHYRDIGDSIYQCNTILDNTPTKDRLRVMDFGGGYGRLSIPFIHHLRGGITYFSVDYVPVSLLLAPQFVKQAVDANTMGWDNSGNNFDDYDFVSLPSWKLDDLNCEIDVFVTIHSFQEMTDGAVKYYIDTANRLSKDGTLFYSVNLPTRGNENVIIPDNWVLISEKAYPINRDGSFFERMWKIRR